MTDHGYRRRAPAFLMMAFATCTWSCSRATLDSSTVSGSVGPGGGTIVVQQGPLAGTAITLAPNALPENTALAIDRATSRNYADLIAVGPAAKISPDTISAAATVTLVFDPSDPEVAANDPNADLVVMRLDAQDRLRVLPTTSLDLTTGRVQTRTADLGTFWVAIRPANAPFSLADFVPDEGDAFDYTANSRLWAETPFADPNIQPGEWLGWHLVRNAVALPAIPSQRRGIYLDYGADDSITFAGAFAHRGFFLGSEFQFLAATPLVVPPTVLEGETFENAPGVDTYQPWGSTTPVPQSGGLRVRIGERGSMTVPAGSFGDVVRVCFEVHLNGSTVYWLDVDLARGIGPIAYEELGLGGVMIRAYLP